MTPSKSSLITDFGWVFSGNVVYAACQWLIVLLFSKLGSPEQLGEYALGVAVVTPILVMANLQIRALVASDVRDQYSFSQYLSFRGVTLAIAFLAVTGLVLADKMSWHLRGIILVVGLGQVLEYVADAYYGLMQKCGRLDRISRSAMIKGPFSLFALALLLYSTRDVFWAVGGLMVGRLLVVVAYDSRLRFTENCLMGAVAVRCEWDWNMMWRLLQTAWPFGVIALLASLNGNIPRYFIEHQAGTRSLGIFAALYSLVAMGTLFINAFGQSVFMPAALSYAENDGPEFRRIIGRFTLMAAGLGVAAVVIAMLVGKQVLTLLYRPEYADRNLLVQLMVVGGIYWIATAQGYILTAVRVLREQIALLVCAVAIAAGGCAWLVPNQGAMGAAHALQMSVAAQCVGGSILLWRANRKIEKCAVIENGYAASVELG